jgi:hypothetical protein
MQDNYDYHNIIPRPFLSAGLHNHNNDHEMIEVLQTYIKLSFSLSHTQTLTCTYCIMHQIVIKVKVKESCRENAKKSELKFT